MHEVWLTIKPYDVINQKYIFILCFYVSFSHNADKNSKSEIEKEKTRSVLKFIEISVTLTGVTNTKRRGRNDIESLEYFDSAYSVHVTLNIYIYIHALKTFK